MKNERLVRQIMMDNAIRIVAEDGFEGATTNAITYSGPDAGEIKMNEVYIYRLFGCKEQIFDRAFEMVEDGFSDAACGAVDGDFCEFVAAVLLFWREKPLWCRYYAAYCHSHRLYGLTKSYHEKVFNRIVKRVKGYFVPDVPAETVMHILLNAIVDMAYQTATGTDTEWNEQTAVDALCGIGRPYLK